MIYICILFFLKRNSNYLPELPAAAMIGKPPLIAAVTALSKRSALGAILGTPRDMLTMDFTFLFFFASLIAHCKPDNTPDTAP